MSALSSLASSSLSLGHIDSIAVIYSRLGMLLGDMAKLGPFANTAFCAGVKLVLDRFMTHIQMFLSLIDWLLLSDLAALIPWVDHIVIKTTIITILIWFVFIAKNIKLSYLSSLDLVEHFLSYLFNETNASI